MPRFGAAKSSWSARLTRRRSGSAQARGYIPAGSCPGGSEPLVKPIAAMAGDVVAVSAAGVAVNGQAVQDTAQLAGTAPGGPCSRFRREPIRSRRERCGFCPDTIRAASTAAISARCRRRTCRAWPGQSWVLR